MEGDFPKMFSVHCNVNREGKLINASMKFILLLRKSLRKNHRNTPITKFQLIILLSILILDHGRLKIKSYMNGCYCERILSQEIIQCHHDYKTYNDAKSCHARAAFRMGFRNDFIADYKKHGTGCKGQAERQDRVKNTY